MSDWIGELAWGVVREIKQVADVTPPLMRTNMPVQSTGSARTAPTGRALSAHPSVRARRRGTIGTAEPRCSAVYEFVEFQASSMGKDDA
ncbi:hypothetical protein [Marivita geojedonensis]|uniref:hypothetical protein n=1 Tax=Marivita geojedonensis TaxID=1123756 RepID=UPI00117D69ED|nr:hypothetical protein [Marivita geojedonensis]